MRRLLLAAVLIGAFISLAAYYDANVTYHLDSPRESEVSANYEAYVGRNVTISGEVISTSTRSFELKGALDTYTIFSTEAVQRGDRVTVYGVLGPGHHLQAVAMAVSPWVLAALVYVRSFVALIFVSVLFFVRWRFDRHGWVIRPKKPRSREQDGV
ncbi:MAG: hypothetical protein ACXV3D_00195 [Halobacteriota archaeon]